VQPLLNIAVRAARSAGEVIIRSLNRLESLKVTSKGRNDFVTEVDHAAEAEIIGIIRRHHPSHAFLAEESGASGDSDTVWIIDPLDGTTNFMHGFPVFAVSIACQVKGRLEHAVVYDPMRGEIFSASRGDGAHLDNRRMRVSKARGLDGTLISTGFPYTQSRHLDAYWACCARSPSRPPACAAPARPRSTWPMWPPDAWTDSGRSACRPGTPPPERFNPGGRRADRHAHRR
jgi:myo-inositol-1(or 4)-monophosphatase